MIKFLGSILNGLLSFGDWFLTKASWTARIAILVGGLAIGLGLFFAYQNYMIGSLGEQIVTLENKAKAAKAKGKMKEAATIQKDIDVLKITDAKNKEATGEADKKQKEIQEASESEFDTLKNDYQYCERYGRGSAGCAEYFRKKDELEGKREEVPAEPGEG